ncbi:MAG: cupin domain-containing protein [Nitrospinota bacterium]
MSRTLYTDDRLKAVLFGFAAGQELTEHSAPQPAILHILRGEALLTLGDETMTACAGTWVHMDPHLRHSVLAKTSVLMLLLLVKTGAWCTGRGYGRGSALSLGRKVTRALLKL